MKFYDLKTGTKPETGGDPCRFMKLFVGEKKSGGNPVVFPEALPKKGLFGIEPKNRPGGLASFLHNGVNRHRG